MFHVEQYLEITVESLITDYMDKNLLLENLRNIPDFPIPGIQFKDVTSLFKKPECLREMDNALYELYKDKGITKIVGIESRGFVMASSLAVKLNAGFVPIRKPGKLPAETISETYGKEYGRDTIEIQHRGWLHHLHLRHLRPQLHR